MLLGVEGREGIRGEPELDVQGIRGDEREETWAGGGAVGVKEVCREQVLGVAIVECLLLYNW